MPATTTAHSGFLLSRKRAKHGSPIANVAPLSQVCIKCQVNKPLASFAKERSRPSHRTTCKVCRYGQRDLERDKARHRVRMRERRVDEPDVLRRNWERCTYGAAKEDIGVDACMICGSKRKLCIDHDHQSDRIRGVLCGKCNTAIGMFDDDPNRMEKAAAYVRDGPHIELDRARYPG